jgi:hypothetical protein
MRSIYNLVHDSAFLHTAYLLCTKGNGHQCPDGGHAHSSSTAWYRVSAVMRSRATHTARARFISYWVHPRAALMTPAVAGPCSVSQAWSTSRPRTVAPYSSMFWLRSPQPSQTEVTHYTT